MTREKFAHIVGQRDVLTHRPRWANNAPRRADTGPWCACAMEPQPLHSPAFEMSRVGPLGARESRPKSPPDAVLTLSVPLENSPARPAARRGGKAWLTTALTALGLAVPAVVGIYVRARPDTLPDVRGVRLGLTAAQLRASFQPPGPGQWSSRASAVPGEIEVTYTPTSDPSLATRFEFHDGLLVAATLPVQPGTAEAGGPALRVTERALLVRIPSSSSPGRTDLRLLARDCPTHSAEVRQRLSRR